MPRGGTVIVNTDEFTARALRKVGYEKDPLDDGSLDGYRVHRVALTSQTVKALDGHPLSRKEAERAKNMYALGLLSWLYHRPVEQTLRFLEQKFARRPEIIAANRAAFQAGWNFGETTEEFEVSYEVAPATLPPGRYRNISGNPALAYGLIAASQRSGLPLFLGSYPITPASDILHELAKHKAFGVRTFQAEDEIAAIGAALGAAYGGALGVTTTSGPGVALKSEAIGLAVSLELPLVICDIQRGGPSTGLPTKTEQADLLQAMFGRNGESPVPIVAPRSPADCFDAALEAARIALTYRTPVFLLSDGYLANGSEPWRIPDVDQLPDLRGAVRFARAEDYPEGTAYLPYQRDPETLARTWAVPGHRRPRAPDRRPREGRRHRRDLLRPGEPRPHGAHPGRRRSPGSRRRSRRWWPTTRPARRRCWCSAGARPTARRRPRAGWCGSAAAPSRTPTCATSTPSRRTWASCCEHYDRVLIPEMNLGQLALLVRARYLVDAVGYNKVRGLPFTSTELAGAIEEIAEQGSC